SALRAKVSPILGREQRACPSAAAAPSARTRWQPLRVLRHLASGAGGDIPRRPRAASPRRRRRDAGKSRASLRLLFAAKGARTTASDPHPGQLTTVLNPRTNRWNEHFRVEGVLIVGHTSIGRASVQLLAMNRPLAVEIRREEALKGRYPPVT